jgi:hypothetical protein
MRGLLCVVFSLFLTPGLGQAQETRLEDLHNKSILVFTPHPDDDVFGAGGTIALLNRNHNKVLIVVYTNDDKGSYDPDMSSQRLARIRRAEQEASEGLLGTPKENIMWMGYDDGMLEYAPQPKLTEGLPLSFAGSVPTSCSAWTQENGTSAGTKPIIGWLRSTPLTRSGPQNSGCIFLISVYSRDWSPTRFPKCTSAAGSKLFRQHRDRAQVRSGGEASQPVRARGRQVSPGLDARREDLKRQKTRWARNNPKRTDTTSRPFVVPRNLTSTDQAA